MAPKLLSHKLELLSGAASLQLFRLCAGRVGAEDAGPAGLEGKVISACGGLPLALELAGGFLNEEGNADARSWQVCSAPIGTMANARLSLATRRDRFGAVNAWN